MGLPKLKTKMSVDDYLEGEKISQVKHEYVHGEIYEMAGTSDRQNLIAGRIYSKLLNHLADDDKCQVFFADVKVRINQDVFYYPDVFVACDETIENAYFRNQPVLIIEVLSESTRNIDRREKLFFYQQIPTLQEYVIIEQDKMLVEIHRRQQNGGWLTLFFNNEDEQIQFMSVGMTMSLNELYRRIVF